MPLHTSLSCMVGALEFHSIEYLSIEEAFSPLIDVFRSSPNILRHIGITTPLSRRPQ